ncbi:hypothetical protein AcW1_000826 [Taiwanofungus camphoratus]|nr:hypothetical protein AcW2_000672 [Antrodia cinnamomea]KAI0961859.1 hypothetical protein AcV7_000845 [Antrodia cinnamomea]KAI0963868.1 hypothetical protein AcW1_000826 [Antrodia cinnamomea]
MPKAPTVSVTHAIGPVPFHNAHVLRRNQACHQCRRRKLKCDAKRPCSTCVRSHTYAVAHAPAGTDLPPHPQCTFDEVSEADDAEQYEHPKTRFERLESRINELEALLREKEKVSVQKPSETNLEIPSGNHNGLTNGGGIVPSAQSDSIQLVDPFHLGRATNPDDSLALAQFHMGSALDNLAGVASLIGTSPASSPVSHIRTASASPTIVNEPAGLSSSSMNFGHGLDLLYVSWPRNLPNPGFLRHLVEAFFSFHPDATHLFHQATFMSALSMPPNHPNFPSTAVLHAICAVGSMYTAAVPQPQNPMSPDFSPYDIYPDKYKAREGILDSFSDLQAKYAKAALESSVDMGRELFQNVQAQILLAWWYWCNAKWAEAFLASSHALRYCLPCGLNVYPPFHTLAETLRPPSLLLPPKNAIEDEMRRNAFWIAYAIERTHGSGNGWAMVLDDQDVSQLLPIRYDQFERGVLVLPNERQWSHDKDALSSHPDGQVDPFILYIKSTMLLSRVKNFNLRFRSKYYAGDPSIVTQYNTTKGVDCLDPGDARQTPAFIELDELVTSFKSSFPPHLRNPIKDNAVNPHLFAACTASHFVQILLHESHAVVGKSTCSSSCKILDAARAILDLLYNVCATSYDLSLLGLFPMICWFMAGRVLVRFLRVAIDVNSEELSSTLRVEVAFIRMVISKVGEHIPLAHRYGKMLHDFTIQMCGEQFVDPLPMTLPPRCDFSTSYDGNLYDASQSILNSSLIRTGPLIS